MQTGSLENAFLSSAYQAIELIGEQIMALSTDVANLEKARLLTLIGGYGALVMNTYNILMVLIFGRVYFAPNPMLIQQTAPSTPS